MPAAVAKAPSLLVWPWLSARGGQFNRSRRLSWGAVGFDLQISAHFGIWHFRGVFPGGFIVVVLHPVDSVGLDHVNLGLLRSVASVL